VQILLSKSRLSRKFLSVIVAFTVVIGGYVVYRSHASGTDFVTRSGQQLLLNGQPYRILGFNMYRANVSFAMPNDTNYLLNNGTSLNDSLVAINANGGKKDVFRAWFIQQEVTPTTSGYNWAPFDKTLQVAQANGYKVIATLADQWNYEGPPYKDLTWYQGGYKTAVYNGTLNGVSYNENVPYYQYVHDVVARYANNPTIAAWEMVNEAEDSPDPSSCPANAEAVMQSFAQTVGDEIRGLDPNHLISLGNAGNGNCGALDSDYQTLMSIPELDLCSFHDYEGATNASAFNSANGLNVRVQQCAAVNKPIYVGEVGINLYDSAVNGSEQTRANLLDNKLSAQFGLQGVVGFIPWQYDNRVPPDYPCCSTDYSYGQTDPALAVMDNYALATPTPTSTPTATPSPTPTPTTSPSPTATPTPVPLVGDLNGDGHVNIFDLSILLSAWGTSSATADLNHDGTVNIFDLSVLLSHWTG
jgi:hypothetical protein